MIPPALSASPGCEQLTACLVIGVGSPHGDDRAGWEVADKLSSRYRELTYERIRVRKASVPHDMLDWLECDTKTHIVDACQSSARCIQRFEVLANEVGCIRLITEAGTGTHIESQFATFRSGSSHQIDLISTLRLASTLGTLPQRLVLWAIPALDMGYSACLHAETLDHVAECVKRILQEQLDA